MSDSPQVPALIAGRYVPTQLLGQGSVGTVFLATDKVLRRQVAVKLVSRGHFVDSGPRQFLEEGRILSQLSHPGIVQVYDVAESEAGVSIVMRHIEGPSLQRTLAAGPVESALAKHWIRGLAEALQHVHSHGIIHRDIKPSNILFEPTRDPVLVDFGLAREQVVVTSDERSATVAGTPRYMAPELLEGAPPSGATDVFALGMVASELILWADLHGDRGWDHCPNLSDILSSLATSAYYHVAQRRMRSIGPWKACLLAAIDPNPRRRVQTPREFLDMIPEIPQLVDLDARGPKSSRSGGIEGPATQTAVLRVVEPGAPVEPGTGRHGTRAAVVLGVVSALALGLWQREPARPETAAVSPAAAPAVSALPVAPVSSASPAVAPWLQDLQEQFLHASRLKDRARSQRLAANFLDHLVQEREAPAGASIEPLLMGVALEEWARQMGSLAGAIEGLQPRFEAWRLDGLIARTADPTRSQILLEPMVRHKRRFLSIQPQFAAMSAQYTRCLGLIAPLWSLNLPRPVEPALLYRASVQLGRILQEEDYFDHRRELERVRRLLKEKGGAGAAWPVVLLEARVLMTGAGSRQARKERSLPLVRSVAAALGDELPARLVPGLAGTSNWDLWFEAHCEIRDLLEDIGRWDDAAALEAEMRASLVRRDEPRAREMVGLLARRVPPRGSAASR